MAKTPTRDGVTRGLPGPFGLVLGGVTTAFDVARAGYDLAEAFWLRQLKSRLDDLETRDARRSTQAAERDRDTTPGSPAALLDELLARSLDQTSDEAREAVFRRILRDLTPDEARMLAALSDGDTFAVVHVQETTALGGGGRRVLAWVSNLGQAAAVEWREHAPSYLAHLVTLGLVETGPEDPDLRLRYEVLDGDTTVRRTLAALDADGKRARVVRRSVRLSSLGAELWAACRPSDIER